MSKIYSYLLLALLFVNSNKAIAEPIQNVDDYINTLANHVINVVKDKAITKKEKTDQIFQILQTNFNLSWMSKFVIGKNYRQLTPQQKSEYQDTYAKFFLYSYLPNLMKYTDESFKITKTFESTPNNYTVETLVQRTDGQAPLSINYQVKPKQDAPDQYQVIDIVVEGVSAIMSHRSEFASTIQQSGVDGFISQLQAKTKLLEDKSNHA